MSEKNKTKIYEYLKKVIQQKKEHSDYIDYYSLYDLNKNMSIEEINESIKNQKLKVLFHPDQEKFIDDNFKQIYEEASNYLLEMQDIFSDEAKKQNYDQYLQEKQQHNVSNNNKITEQDIENLDLAIENTIHKYGFNQGYYALQSIIAKNDFQYVTNQNNFRNILKEMGNFKIRKIIYDSRIKSMENDPNNMIMDYYCKILNRDSLKQKADSFYNACLNTAEKYDLNGYNNQTSIAIQKFIMNNDIKGFTNQNGSRDNLIINNIKPTCVKILMSVKMHNLRDVNEDNSFANYSKKTQEEQIKLFSDVIIKEAKGLKQREIQL